MLNGKIIMFRPLYSRALVYIYITVAYCYSVNHAFPQTWFMIVWNHWLCGVTSSGHWRCKVLSVNISLELIVDKMCHHGSNIMSQYLAEFEYILNCPCTEHVFYIQWQRGA